MKKKQEIEAIFYLFKTKLRFLFIYMTVVFEGIYLFIIAFEINLMDIHFCKFLNDSINPLVVFLNFLEVYRKRR